MVLLLETVNGMSSLKCGNLLTQIDKNLDNDFASWQKRDWF